MNMSASVCVKNGLQQKCFQPLLTDSFIGTESEAGHFRPLTQLIPVAVAMDSANRLLTRRVLDKLKSIATGEEGEAKPVKKKTAASTAKDKTKKAAASGFE